MKRLIICIFFCGLFVASNAVTLVVERLNGAAVTTDPVRSLVLSSGNTVQCNLINGQSTQLDQVRTILFKGKSTAVDNVVSTTSVHVYPNPTADALVIEGVEKQCKLNIYSVNGSIVLSEFVEQGTNNINVSNLPKGVYLLELPNESFKLIKQ